MPQSYLDWLIAKLVPLALRGSWEVGIDPLDPDHEPHADPEEHGVGIVGDWARESALSPNWREKLAPADYAMLFSYIVDGPIYTVRWQVLGKTVFSTSSDRRLCVFEQ